MHHLTSERIEIANIIELSARHGHPNRAFVFASTSKITLAGAGLALFASSPENVKWLLARFVPRTIGPDKVNQLRHVRFLKDEAGIHQLMDKHRALLAPKFQKVLDIFDEKLGGVPDVTWNRPKGGYFIALDVPQGCAPARGGAGQRSWRRADPGWGALILTAKIPTIARCALLLHFRRCLRWA